MKENRRDTLRSALDNMRQHTAPDGAWEMIESQLDTSSEIVQEPVLQDGIRRMASYRAPARIWGRITDQMEHPYRNLIRWSSAIAASMILLVGLGFFLTRSQAELPPAPVAEKRLPDATHLSPAEGVTYASAWQDQFMALEICLEGQADQAALYETAVWEQIQTCAKQLDEGLKSAPESWQTCERLLDSLQSVYCQESPK
ncbi:MAG: hypothetical protein AAFV07_06120 [Bacteroidota bacterium]